MSFPYTRTVHKQIHVTDLQAALDEVEQILANKRSDQERHETMAYIVYRGYHAIREEYDALMRNEKGAMRRRVHQTPAPDRVQ